MRRGAVLSSELNRRALGDAIWFIEQNRVCAQAGRGPSSMLSIFYISLPRVSEPALSPNPWARWGHGSLARPGSRGRAFRTTAFVYTVVGASCRAEPKEVPPEGECEPIGANISRGLFRSMPRDWFATRAQGIPRYRPIVDNMVRHHIGSSFGDEKSPSTLLLAW